MNDAKRSPAVPAMLCAVMIALTVFLMALDAEAYELAAAEEVTLEQALDYFYKHNYDLLINQYEIDKATAGLAGARRLPNPEVSLGYTGMETNRSLAAGNNAQATFRVDQLFELGGKRSLRTGAAQENLEATKLSHQDLARVILEGFHSLYWGLALDILNLRLTQEALQQFDRLLSVAETRFTAGFLSLVDYTKLKVARTDLENHAISAERQVNSSGEQLRVLIGIDKPVRPDGGGMSERFPEYREEDLLAKAYGSRKDLLSLQRQLNAAEYNLSLAKAYRIPDVTVGAEYERFGPDREPGMGIGVSLPIPLFNLNQAEIAKRKAEQKQIELQMVKTKRQIEADVRQALQSYAMANRALRAYRNGKTDMEELRARSEKAFSLGGITVLDFLDTQRTYREFMNKYNQALVQVVLNHELIKLNTGETR